MSTFIPRTRLQIRQSVGQHVGAINGLTTALGSTSTLIDTYGLARGGDDEFNGHQLIIDTLVAGGPAVGEKSWVTDYATATKQCTIAPIVSLAIQAGTVYELWQEPYTVEQVNELINQAIMTVAGRALVESTTYNNRVVSSLQEYRILSDFAAVYKVEYANGNELETVLSACDAAWTAVDADVTQTNDTTYYKEGTGSLKLAVAAGCGAGDLLGYLNYTTVKDLSKYDSIELWVYSSVDLAAGDIHFHLDNTAACASPVETIDIPAIPASTWTHVVLNLANPASDYSIASIGLTMVVDKGAFNLYVDDINAIKPGYETLHPNFWDIISDPLPTLRLTDDGLSMVGEDSILRISGYINPSVMSADTDICTVNPEYIVAQVTGQLLLANSNAKQDAQYWLAMAENMKRQIVTQYKQGTRIIG